MGVTSPDSIYVHENHLPASLVQVSQSQGASVQAALNKRQRYDFVWPTATERAAQTGMVRGSRGLQLDRDIEWVYTGAFWRINNMLMQPFTPDFVELTTGSGSTVNGFVTISAGWANVYVSVTLGTGFSIGDPHLIAPVDAPLSTTLSGLGSIKVGVSNFEDVSTGAGGRFEGTALSSTSVAGVPYPNGLFRCGSISSSPVQFSPLNNTNPFTWVAGDKLHMNINYPVN